MADNDFAKMLLADIRRHHERMERAREAGYVGLLEDLDSPPTITKHHFRVIDGGRADRVALRGR
jgi:hypothetical protein